MVNGHCIHFYKNKYNKLIPILLIHLFQHTPRCKRVNETTCSDLLTTDYIVISKSKSVPHCAFCIPVLLIQPLHPSLLPLPQSSLLSPSS